MIDKIGALWGVTKLADRIEKIVGAKRLNKFLGKRKGLGRSRSGKIADYAIRKPASTERRLKRINTALNVAPYVATGAATLGIASLLSGPSKKDKKS